MTTQRRPGRPPGSKNKPKATPTSPAPSEDTYTTTVPTAAADTVSTTISSDSITIPPNTDWATPVPSFTTGSDAGGGTYVLRKKQGMGKGSEEYPLDWPKDWPIPRKGQTLRLDDQRISVTSVEFNLDDGKIVVVCE